MTTLRSVAPKTLIKGKTISVRAEPSDPELAAYLRGLEQAPLMGPAEEVEVGLRILRLRREYWIRLLDYPPFLVALAESTEQNLTRDKLAAVPLDDLRRVAHAYQTRRTAAGRAAIRRAVESVAEAMAEVDPSCDVADMLAADIESLAGGITRGVTLDVRQPRQGSVPFARYVRDMRRTRLCLHEARREFARANLRLVVSMASRWRRSGRMSLADLIQEGNLGLMTAVDRFDPRKGFRFSTYAAWWIRHAINRALSDKGRAVRLPVHVIELQSKLAKIRREFEQEHRREPDADELAELADVPLDKVERFGRILLEQQTPPPQTDESGRVQGIEAIADDGPEASDTLDQGHLDDVLDRALDTLRPMEADILRMRFGLDGSESLTLREIGELYSLSRERIRQIQERALRKLRSELETEGFDEAPETYHAAFA